MGMPRIIFKLLKYFNLLYLLFYYFYVILYRNLATNFHYGLLNDTHDLPCSTFKMFYHHGGDHVARGQTKIILHMAP